MPTVVLLAALGVLAEEDGEDRIVRENVRVEISVRVDCDGRCSGALLEFGSREIDNIIVCERCKKFINGGLVPLQNIGEAVVGGIVQNQMCLGRCRHRQGTLIVTDEFGLYHLGLFNRG